MERMSIRILTLFSISVSVFSNDRNDSEFADGIKRPGTRKIHTNYGDVRGIILQLSNHELQPVEAFLGVPFAAAPVGPLRFMPPTKSPSWKGTRDVNKMSNVCPQRLPNITDNGQAVKRMPSGRYGYLKRLQEYLARQSEDCLYLNIYKPARITGSDNRLPTIVFLHGESFDWGSGNPYDGSVLSSVGDAVVITLNYRLGLLGFFATSQGGDNNGFRSSGGNLALLDIISALSWIQENIKFFGGNQHNVTLCGHGKGAILAQLLMVSPNAKGLFRRVILMSGSALSPTALNYQPLNLSLQIANAVGCPISTSSHMMQCMRHKSVYELLFADKSSYDLHSPGFGPIIDGDIVRDYPDVLMTSTEVTQYQSLDLLFGMTKVESYFTFSSQEVRFGLEEEKRNRIIQQYINKTVPYHRDELAAIAVNEYTDWTKTIQHPINMLDAASEIIGDADVAAPLILSGNYHYKSNRPISSTYSYVFTYQTRDGDYSDRMGCIHGEELPYLFGAPFSRGKFAHFQNKYSELEQHLSEAVIAFWTNFARTGNPNLHRTEIREDKFKKVTWHPYDVMNKKYLSFGSKTRVRDHYRAHKLSIWLHLLPQLIPMYPGGSARIPESTRPPKTTPIWTTLRPYTTLTTDQQPTRRIVPLIPDPADDKTSSKSYKLNHNVYSTALTITIAVGCSLLIVNVIIFVGIYYQRDRSKGRPPDVSSDTTKEKNYGDNKIVRDSGVYGSTLQIPADAYELRDKPPSFYNASPAAVYMGASVRAPPSSPAEQMQNSTLRRKQHFYPGDLMPPPHPVVIMEPPRK